MQIATFSHVVAAERLDQVRQALDGCEHFAGEFRDADSRAFAARRDHRHLLAFVQRRRHCLRDLCVCVTKREVLGR